MGEYGMTYADRNDNTVLTIVSFVLKTMNKWGKNISIGTAETFGTVGYDA